MDHTPPPTSLAAALALPRMPGRSAEVFIDGDLGVRFAARPTNGPQVPPLRDELYFVGAGTGRYRVDDKVTAVGPGDLLFCAAHVAHGFELSFQFLYRSRFRKTLPRAAAEGCRSDAVGKFLNYATANALVGTGTLSTTNGSVRRVPHVTARPGDRRSQTTPERRNLLNPDKFPHATGRSV